MLSLGFTVGAIYETFFAPFRQKDTVINISNLGISISLLALKASALRVLAIFYVKQTVWSAYTPKQCVLLTVTPFVQWINDENGINIHNSNQIQLAAH